MKINEMLERLEDVSYPITVDALVNEFDDQELDVANGSDRLENVFVRTRTTELKCSDCAKLTVLAGVTEDAIGRKGYSDRDPPLPNASGPDSRTL